MFPGQALIAQGDPFQVSINNIPGQPGEYANLTVDVPAGKTLVALFTSVRVTVPSGQAVHAEINANGPPGVIVGTQYFALSFQGSFAGNDVFTASSSVLLWMAGTAGAFSIVRNSTVGLMSCEVGVSGFLIPQGGP